MVDIFKDYNIRNKPIEDNVLQELCLLGDNWSFAGFHGHLASAKRVATSTDRKTAIREVSINTMKHRFWALFIKE